jgi:shikimate dehydrogenase
MTDRYVVIGNPIAHSLSPRIHAEFARQTQQDLRYDAVLAPLEGFPACVAALVRGGVRGANVTVPFKTEAWELAQHRSPRAAAARAANTLRFDRDGTHADNTDGVGLIRDLVDNVGIDLVGRHVLLLGAGGAARGVLLPLLAARVAGVTVVNRTASKARELAAEVSAVADVACAGTGGVLRSCGYDELYGTGFDVIVNATSGGLRGEAPPLPAHAVMPDTVAYDMVYGKGLTPFLALCRAAGALRCVDGLGMLVEQAAEAFEWWRGVRPRASEVLAELRVSFPAP